MLKPFVCCFNNDTNELNAIKMKFNTVAVNSLHLVLI